MLDSTIFANTFTVIKEDCREEKKIIYIIYIIDI